MMSGMRMTTAGAAAGALGLLLTASVAGVRRYRGGAIGKRLPIRLAGHGGEWLEHKLETGRRAGGEWLERTLESGRRAGGEWLERTLESGRRAGGETAERLGSAARRLDRLRASAAEGLAHGKARRPLHALRWIAAAALFGVLLQALEAEGGRRPRPARPRWARRWRRRAAVREVARRAAAHVAFGALTAAAYELLSDHRP